jgi:hypothetical protein
MQPNETATGGGAERLARDLEQAIARARTWEYDIPCARTLARAQALFAELAGALPSVDNLEVSVGADGSIDLFAGNDTFAVSLEVTPSARLNGVTRDVVQSEVIWEATEPPIARILTELERAD